MSLGAYKWVMLVIFTKYVLLIDLNIDLLVADSRLGL